MEKRLTEQLNKAKREFGQPPYRISATHTWQAVHSVACHSDMGKRHNMEVLVARMPSIRPSIHPSIHRHNVMIVSGNHHE
jgi:hypothetical protein